MKTPSLVGFFLLGFSAITLSAQPPNSPFGLAFVPVNPCRVVDTRNATGPFGGPQLEAGTAREFDLLQGACNIPATALAYSLNVTVVPHGPLNFLTLWPTGQPQPLVSTLNSDGRVKANAAITAAGINAGGVSLYVTDATDVILDINGYFVPSQTASALEFFPLTPCRIADSRLTNGPLGGPFLSANTSRSFPILSSTCGIPSSAQAYSLNVTSLPHQTLEYLTAWPTGQPQPFVSTLNSYSGTVTANAAVVPAGSNGDISIYVTDDADLVLDVNGYFAPPSTSGLLYFTDTPCRVVDTRLSSGAFSATLKIPVLAGPCPLPGTAQAYVSNATVVPNSALQYLTLWPDGQPQPYVSTLNAYDGAVTSNMAIVPTVDGSLDAFSTNPTNLILDVSGHFGPTVANTLDGTYLPLAKNNKWTFSDGSYLLDEGLATDVCCGSGTNGSIPFQYPGPEDLVYFDKNGNYVFEMLFIKSLVLSTANVPIGSITYLVGFANDGPIQVTGLPPILVGANSDYSVPGLSWMINENPQLNQSFSDSFAQYATATIKSINGGQPYGQNQQITDVAQINLSAPGLAAGPQEVLYPYATGTYSLAYGVGFTTFPGPNGTTLTLIDFNITAPPQ